jgi:antitoxin FitA
LPTDRRPDSISHEFLVGTSFAVWTAMTLSGSAPPIATPTDMTIDMPIECEHATGMSRMVQLKNVPDDLHRLLKARAAMEGMTLSDYLIAEVRRSAERPTPMEMRERLARRGAVTLSVAPADIIREVRDSGESE